MDIHRPQAVEDSGISLSPSYRQLSSELRFESRRLLTFKDWPVEAPIEAGRVAKAGFFATGSGCEVQCFACGGRITSWDYGDQAVLRHRQMNPSCPFLLNRSSNVPLQLETESIPIQSIPRTNLTSPVEVLQSTSHHVTPEPRSRTSSQTQNHTENYGSDQQQIPYIPSHLQVTPTGTGSPLSGSHFTPSAPQVSTATPPLPGQQGISRSFLTHQEWLLLRREDVRLRTFDQRFSSTFLNPLDLAAAGFFYLGIADQVQCAFCRGVVRDWEPQDEPRREHQRLFPSCPFILGLSVGNTPLGEGEAPQRPGRLSVVERTASLPVVGTSGIGGGGQENMTGGLTLTSPNGFEVSPPTQRFTSQMRPNASPDTDSNNMQLNALIGENLEELGIQKHSGPRFAAYTTVEARLKSFTNWPARLKQTPRAMAEAGFFYLGTSDHVNCFHCGSGLRNWEPEDDPWLEHARWFPQCRFLLLMKGENFVRAAVAAAVAASSAASSSSAAGTAGRKSPRQPPSREVSESEMRALLESTVAQTVLAMGVDLSRVKQAYQMRLRSMGSPFTTVDSLLEAAIEIQHSNEHRQALEYQDDYEVVDWQEVGRSTIEQSRAAEQSIRDGLPDEAVVQTESRMDVESSVVEATASPASAPSVPMETPSEPPTSTSEVDRTQMLEEEIRRLKEARLCKVCLDQDVSIAYVPCGHIVTCVQCAAALDHCPLCRKNIKGTVRIFFS